jgi:hypothetical protein
MRPDTLDNPTKAKTVATEISIPMAIGRAGRGRRVVIGGSLWRVLEPDEKYPAKVVAGYQLACGMLRRLMASSSPDA